jgi:hypothetical protein
MSEYLFPFEKLDVWPPARIASGSESEAILKPLTLHVLHEERLKLTFK